MLKQLNLEQVKVEIRLAPLDEKPNRPEAERCGNVELYGEEIKSGRGYGMGLSIVAVKF